MAKLKHWDTSEADLGPLCRNCDTYQDGQGIVGFCRLHSSAKAARDLFKRGLKAGIFDDCPAFKKEVQALLKSMGGR